VPAVLRRFQPEILIRQHGCDTYRSDPLAGRSLTVDGTLTCTHGGEETAAGLRSANAASTGRLPAATARTSTSFTIFECTSEIQRMIIGRAVTGLDVR